VIFTRLFRRASVRRQVRAMRRKTATARRAAAHTDALLARRAPTHRRKTR
jgi:hypothetical protein